MTELATNVLYYGDKLDGHGSDCQPLVAIHQRVVLDEPAEETRRFRSDGWVESSPVEVLIRLSERRVEEPGIAHHEPGKRGSGGRPLVGRERVDDPLENSGRDRNDTPIRRTRQCHGASTSLACAEPRRIA